MTPMRAVDAFSKACGSRPSLVRDSGSRQGVGLYGWNTGPVDEVRLPGTHDVILSLHLDGAREVRLHTRSGLTRSVSRPGLLTLMPHGRPIGFRTEGQVEFATLHFPSSLVPRQYQAEWRQLMSLPHCLFAFRDDYLHHGICTLMRAAQLPVQDSEPFRRGLFDAMLSHLARRIGDAGDETIVLPTRSERGLREPDIDAALAHIEQHLADKLTVEDLASIAGVGRALFAREFAARLGCTPHRYLNQRRIERAKTLLLDPGFSLGDIAYEVGFSGPSHFTSVFRALEGRTPSAYLIDAR